MRSRQLAEKEQKTGSPKIENLRRKKAFTEHNRGRPKTHSLSARNDSVPIFTTEERSGEKSAFFPLFSGEWILLSSK